MQLRFLHAAPSCGGSFCHGVIYTYIYIYIYLLEIPCRPTEESAPCTCTCNRNVCWRANKIGLLHYFPCPVFTKPRKLCQVGARLLAYICVCVFFFFLPSHSLRVVPGDISALSERGAEGPATDLRAPLVFKVPIARFRTMGPVLLHAFMAEDLSC